MTATTVKIDAANSATLINEMGADEHSFDQIVNRLIDQALKQVVYRREQNRKNNARKTALLSSARSIVAGMKERGEEIPEELQMFA